MIPKKLYISGVIVIALISVAFFLQDTVRQNKKVSDMDKPGLATRLDLPLQNPTAGDIQTNKIPSKTRLNFNPPEESNSNCQIIKTEPIFISAPLEGKIKYLVKEDDMIKKGDIVATITKTFSNQEDNMTVSTTDIDILKSEVESVTKDISIARMDIENINGEVQELNNKFLDASYAHSTALIDFENNLISREKMNEIEETFELSRIHITDLEKMLNGKYTAINAYNNRISKLKTILTIPDTSKKGTVKVVSDFEGKVDEIFYNNNEETEEGLPLMTIRASNVASVDFLGKIPFSEDGKKASLTIDTEKFQAKGRLKLIGYKQNNGYEATSAWIVFPGDITIQEKYFGKKALLSYHAD